MLPGELVDGRFEVQRFAGKGGVGTVFKGRDRLSDRPVAIKVLQSTPPEESPRFAREASMLSRLSHPGIVRYLAHGTTRQGEMYLAMDWLEGEDLNQRLNRGILRIDDSIKVIRRAAQALAEAHQQGIVHRDIKPSNLFLIQSDPDQLVVLDFGIARPMLSTLSVTATGAVIGTPGYMAPEQARGQHDVDARADVFSLGCVLYECLTGQHAFPGTNLAAVLAKVLFDQVPSVRDLRPEVPERLDALIGRMLAKEPERRLPDATAVLAVLKRLEIEEAEGVIPEVLRPQSITESEQRLLSVALISLSEEPSLESATTHTMRDTASLLSSLRTLVEPLGAELAPLAGDGAMLLLKGQGNAADQAVRAAACGLSVFSALPGSRVALTMGRAEVAGKWPVGPVVDRAAKLLERAVSTSAEAVLVDSAMAALIESRYRVEGRGPVRKLLGEREAGSHARPLLGKPTPCVGRQTELAFLEGILSECMNEPEARAVLVTAPSGIGKSRLGCEFMEKARERGEALRLLTARGDPVYAGSAFMLAAQLIRGAIELSEGDAVAAQYDRLRAYLERLFEGRPPGHTAEFLGELVRAPITDMPSPQLVAARNDPRIMFERLRSAFESLLGAMASRAALLLVLDDLHWGDLPTVTFLENALKKHADMPIMMLACARPEVDEVFPRLWSGVGLQRIELRALKHRAAERLARHALGDRFCAETINRIVKQAAGNTFFLEELIRHVAEGGEWELPESVLSMVQSRLENLDREARRILRAASIYGEVFWEGGVRALLGDTIPATGISRWLDVMVENEMLSRVMDDKFPSEPTFAFRHGTFREAAYAMLTERDRRLGHSLAAAWLEQAGERDPLVLAEHFQQGGEKQRAVRYFILAAQAAYDGGNYRAIIPICERAIGCGARGQERGEIMLSVARKHAVSDEMKKVSKPAEDALALLPEGSVPWFSAVALLSISGAYTGNLASLLRALEAFQGYRDELPASGPAGIAGYVLHGGLVHGGQREAALRLRKRMERAEKNAERMDPVFSGYLCLLRTFSSLLGLSELGDALPNAERALDLFADARDELAQSLAYYIKGWSQIAVGDFEAGERTCQQGLEHSQRLGFGWAEGTTTVFLGFARIMRGQEQAGIETLKPLLANADSLNGFLAQAFIAVALFREGRLSEARRDAAEAVKRSAFFPTAQTVALAVLGRIELDQERFQEAAAHASRALETSECGNIDCLDPMLRLTQVEAARALGRTEEAKDMARLARERLLQQAQSLNDPALRELYLKNTLDAERTLDLAQRWLGNGT